VPKKNDINSSLAGSILLSGWPRLHHANGDPTHESSSKEGKKKKESISWYFDKTRAQSLAESVAIGKIGKR